MVTLMEGAHIRILVAMEDDYRAYRETIAVGLRILRPGVKVESTTLEALKEELKRFDPQVVICGGHEDHEDLEPDDRPAAWIELSLDSTLPTKISVGGRHLERTNPTMGELLKVIDGFKLTHQY